jgi:hypothetical protein
MPAALELDNGKHITYESALKKDINIINGAAYPAARRQLFQKLWDQRATIQDIVRHHLRLRDKDACIVKAENQWIRGSFNVCIPVEVRSVVYISNKLFLTLEGSGISHAIRTILAVTAPESPLISTLIPMNSHYSE